MTPASDPQNVIRLLPDEPFPPYAFIPGRFPHPESDPAGHSFGVPRHTPPPITADNWVSCRPYLRALDLFNARYFWESHVEFESLWIACGRRGRVADFLKGLIKLAAAGVKHLEEKPEGVYSHARRAAELWHGVAQVAGVEERLFGFRLDELIAVAEAVVLDGWPDCSPVLLPALARQTP